MKFRHSLIGYKTAQTDDLLAEEEKNHQAILAQQQSQLQDLLTYQQQLQEQQLILDQMLQKARTRSQVFESFSESLQQYFGRSEQRNAQEIRHCQEAAAQLETEIKQQGDKVESDIIALETFLASVEKHLGDLVNSLGEEFEAGRVLLGEYNKIMQSTASVIELREIPVDMDKLKWTPAEKTEAAAVCEESLSPEVVLAEIVLPEEVSEPKTAETRLMEETATDTITETAASLVPSLETAPDTDRADEVPAPVPEPAKSDAVLVTPIETAETAKSRPRAFTTDDDSTILAILKVMLEREGFEVLQAADGREASGIIDTIEPPNIAIMDLMLPYIDGLQLTKQIRNKAEWANTPILILSSNSTENEMVTLLEAGADDYVIKPFNTRELIARVKRLSEVSVK